MAKVATFIIVIIFIFICVGATLAGTDSFARMPNVQDYFTEYLPNGLWHIKLAFIENPIQMVYDLYSDEDLKTYEAVLVTVPVFVMSCFAFIGNIMVGFSCIFIAPFTDSAFVKIDTSPYI